MRTGEGRWVGAGRDPGAVLVTGGAGYVGSHVVPALREAGYRGGRARRPLDRVGAPPCPMTWRSSRATPAIPKPPPPSIAGHGVASVVHLAASIDIAESLADPLKYDRNNALASAALVRACVAGGVGRFLFASSAAVYGRPGAAPVGEDAPAAAGQSLRALQARDRRAASRNRRPARDALRGAALFQRGGRRPARPGRPVRRGLPPRSRPPAGPRSACADGVTVFGTDYPTPDGTCLRDYIHVSDLAAIHVAALARPRERRAGPGAQLRLGPRRLGARGARGSAGRSRRRLRRSGTARAAPATPRSWSPTPRVCGATCAGRRVTAAFAPSCAARSPGKGRGPVRRAAGRALRCCSPDCPAPASRRLRPGSRRCCASGTAGG